MVIKDSLWGNYEDLSSESMLLMHSYMIITRCIVFSLKLDFLYQQVFFFTLSVTPSVQHGLYDKETEFSL